MSQDELSEFGLDSSCVTDDWAAVAKLAYQVARDDMDDMNASPGKSTLTTSILCILSRPFQSGSLCLYCVGSQSFFERQCLQIGQSIALQQVLCSTLPCTKYSAAPCPTASGSFAKRCEVLETRDRRSKLTWAVYLVLHSDEFVTAASGDPSLLRQTIVHKLRDQGQAVWSPQFQYTTVNQCKEF